jgi:hypothetical protein
MALRAGAVGAVGARFTHAFPPLSATVIELT